MSEVASRFTQLQGQYLAFIRAYALINRRAPAEADMQRFFEVTPPSVHQMVLTLEKRGLIKRTAGVARSTRLLVPADELPPLRERERAAQLGDAPDHARAVGFRRRSWMVRGADRDR